MVLTATALIGCATIATAAPRRVGGPKKPIELQLVSPSDDNLLYREGWSLDLQLVVNESDMLGIGTDGSIAVPNFPGALPLPNLAKGGWIVFDDPDGCWSMGALPPCDTFADETVLEFHPDVGDVVDAYDLSGNYILRQALADPAGRPPIGGPVLSSNFLDGVGYGPDDNLPGLVLVADDGIGVVRTPPEAGWVPVYPAMRYNLGGFIGSVAYQLDTGSRRTVVSVHMVVPPVLFAPVKLVDGCTGTYTDYPYPHCPGEWLQMLPGGAVGPYVLGDLDESTVEVRAFVVASRRGDPSHPWAYPKTITDQDDDGVVGARDAEMMGYQLLSNEVVFEAHQIGNTAGPCSGGGSGNEPFLDMDGNGYAGPVSFACPPGAGRVIAIPR